MHVRRADAHCSGKVDKMMPTLGFNPDRDNDRLVASFSGGWQMRIGLGKILLQVLTRLAGPAESRAAGPPFSVSEADVAALYGAAFEVRKLEEVDALKSNPKFAGEGLTKVTASTYLLTKK